MSSTMLPSAEWISTAARRSATVPRDGGISRGCCPEHVNSPQAGSAGAAASEGSNQQQEDEQVEGHRGSGGLVRGRAVFCLPPGVEWFQGHFAYAERGGCTASLGLLGTELPVDPCMQCCHGGFSRHKLVFIHHASGKECTLIVERYGGNMMSLHAEPSVVAGGDGPVPPESEFSFQTHVMKADEDARALLDRYFQSIVRAASNASELRDCIVCIGQMDVPVSLLQDLAAPLPDSRTHSSAVCSAFAPCRETPQQQDQQQQHLQERDAQHQPQHQPQMRQRGQRNKNTPVLSPYPPSEVGQEEEEKEENKEEEANCVDDSRKGREEAAMKAQLAARAPERNATVAARAPSATDAAAAAAAESILSPCGETSPDNVAPSRYPAKVRSPDEDEERKNEGSGDTANRTSEGQEGQGEGLCQREEAERIGNSERGGGGGVGIKKDDGCGSSGGGDGVTCGSAGASCHGSSGAGDSRVGKDVAIASVGDEKRGETVDEEDDDWLEG